MRGPLRLLAPRWSSSGRAPRLPLTLCRRHKGLAVELLLGLMAPQVLHRLPSRGRSAGDPLSLGPRPLVGPNRSPLRGPTPTVFPNE